MGVSYSPKLFTSGLITYIDPSNSKSYPGSGSTIFDISGNSKNGSLNNSPVYSSDGGGSFQFNGVNQTIGFGIGNTYFPLTQWTLELAFKSTGTTPTTGTSPALLGFTYGWRCFVTTSGLDTRLDDGVGTTVYNVRPGINYQDSNWHYLVWSNNGTLGTYYIDGEYVAQINQLWTGATRWPTNAFQLGRDMNNSMYFFTGFIGLFRFYNTVLTPVEVGANFNSVRSRYGL